MVIVKRALLLSLSLGLALSTLVSAAESKAESDEKADAQSDASRNSGPVVILGTLSDRAHGTLTIRGVGFGDRAAQVWCQNYLMTVISWTDQEIVVHLPDATPDGSYLLTVIRGQGSKDRDVFDMALQGQAGGTAGPKGDKGDVGPQGETGAAGPKGETGATGAQGEAGAMGPQGSPGADGAPGAVGPAGPQGAMGAQGLIGPAGPQGATGPEGPAGPQGAPGAAGPTGATGAAGSMGPVGPMGPMGPMGPAGPQGTPGVSGYEQFATPLTTVSINGNQTTTLTATCPTGKIAIGGGFDYSGNVAPLSTLASFPSAADIWTVKVRLSQVSAASFQGRVYVICVTQ